MPRLLMDRDQAALHRKLHETAEVNEVDTGGKLEESHPVVLASQVISAQEPENIAFMSNDRKRERFLKAMIAACWDPVESNDAVRHSCCYLTFTSLPRHRTSSWLKIV